MRTELLITQRPKLLPCGEVWRGLVLPLGEDLGGAFNYRNACEAYSAPVVYARGANLNEQETNEENVINNNIDEDAIYTQVFPNPSTTQINVAVLSKEQKPIIITLYTILGEQLQQQQTVTNKGICSFNTTNYPIGLYICKITDANGNLVEIKKIFVSHE